MISLAIQGGMLLNLALLFALVFLGSLGVPVSTVILISSGALASTNGQLLAIIIVGAVAASIGDFSAYLLARKFSYRLAPWLRKFKFFKDNEKKTNEQLDSSAFSIVFFTRFLFTGLCGVVSYIYGFKRLDTKRFLVAVILGEILYATIYPLLGFFFKETWSDVADVTSNILTVLALIAITIMALHYYKGYRENRK